MNLSDVLLEICGDVLYNNVINDRMAGRVCRTFADIPADFLGSILGS